MMYLWLIPALLLLLLLVLLFYRAANRSGPDYRAGRKRANEVRTGEEDRS